MIRWKHDLYIHPNRRRNIRADEETLYWVEDMVEQAWVDDGDQVFSAFSVKYFNDLIDFIDENNLMNGK